MRQPPGGDVEFFADNTEHRDALKECTAWEPIFIQRLNHESCSYEISLVGLAAAQVPNLHNEDERTASCNICSTGMSHELGD